MKREDMISFHDNGVEIVMQVAAQGQRELCFSSQRPEEAACVGHLRGDFGRGNEFWTTWWPHHEELRPEGFSAEVDAIVNSLRESGFLSNRHRMQELCGDTGEAKIQFQQRPEYAFRLDSPKVVCFLRCIKAQGDYDFYAYFYERNAFLELERQQKGLPRVCWSTLKTEPGVIAIKYGEMGYYRWDTSGYPDTASDQQIADKLNELGGITKPQIEAMKMGSMFGWQVPAADPKQYDENGRFISHNKHKSERSVR